MYYLKWANCNTGPFYKFMDNVPDIDTHFLLIQ